MKKRSNVLRFCLPFIMASFMAIAGCSGEDTSKAVSSTFGQESNNTAERSTQSMGSEEKAESQESEMGSLDETSISESPPDVREGDIAYDEDGLPYSANQILLYAYPGTNSELIKQLAEEMDADVVDVIPEFQFYQLEFRQDKTYSELMEYVDFFLARQFIMDADLNDYSPETQPD